MSKVSDHALSKCTTDKMHVNDKVGNGQADFSRYIYNSDK